MFDAGRKSCGFRSCDDCRVRGWSAQQVTSAWWCFKSFEFSKSYLCGVVDGDLVCFEWCRSSSGSWCDADCYLLNGTEVSSCKFGHCCKFAGSCAPSVDFEDGSRSNSTVAGSDDESNTFAASEGNADCVTCYDPHASWHKVAQRADPLGSPVGNNVDYFLYHPSDSPENRGLHTRPHQRKLWSFWRITPGHELVYVLSRPKCSQIFFAVGTPSTWPHYPPLICRMFSLRSCVQLGSGRARWWSCSLGMTS